MNMPTTTNPSPYRAVSIFTGAGGLDIGFEQAGFKTVAAVEINKTFCETILVNKDKKIQIPNKDYSYFQDTIVYNKDIAELNATDLNPENMEIDCLIGGPPCQAFSSAGKQNSIFDHRGTLIYEYLRILREIKPKTFLFENVRGLVTARGENGEPGEVLMSLVHKMCDEGYSCNVALLNSADYGSYQRRVRCFIMGSRIGEAPVFPSTTHSKDGNQTTLFDSHKLPWRSLEDFLNEYADNDEANWVRPTAALEASLTNIPDGSGLKSAGRKEATRPSGHWGYRQGTFVADQSKPARTVTGSSSQDWIRLKDGSLRRITLKEAARLQGFPNEWKFSGSIANKFQQVGNAVPSIFGKILGLTIIDYLNNIELHTKPSCRADIAPQILGSIKYTKYDNMKNGAYRVNNFNKIANSI